MKDIHSKQRNKKILSQKIKKDEEEFKTDHIILNERTNTNYKDQ